MKMEKKKYLKYRNVRTKIRFYKNWTSDNLENLTEEIKDFIYNKYVMKCTVLQRDDFACVNTICKSNDSLLTIHHVKFKKNGGKDSDRNCVTLCGGCHKGYHRGKTELVLKTSSELPSHIRGQTFRVTKQEVIDWGTIKKRNKTLRKSLKEHCGIRLSFEQIKLLMKFLSIMYDDENDD